MTKRRNFSTAVRVAIKQRAKRENGQFYCEAPGCGLPCKKGEAHHIVMDAMEIDKSRKLTADQGLWYCLPCHKAATKAQAPVLAKARAREAAHLSAKPPSPRPMQSRGWAKTEKPKREARPVANGTSAIARQFRSET